MRKLLHEITRDADVGIWESQTFTARIYNDKIIVGQPYVKRLGHTGSLDFRKTAIRNQKIVGAVLVDMADECESDAWDRICSAMG